MAIGSDKLTRISIDEFGKDVPKWATDATLRQVRDALDEIADRLIRNRKEAVKTKETAENDLVKGYKRLTKKTDESVKSENSRNRVYYHTTNALEDFRVATKGGFTSITEFSNMFTAGSKFVKSLGQIQSAYGWLGLGLGGVVTLADAMFDKAKKLSSVDIALYNAGLASEQGLRGLVSSAGLANMSLDDFAEIMKKHSTLIVSLGGSKGYASILRQTQNLSRQNYYYGLTINQLNELTTEYLEVARKTGMNERMNSMERANSANRFIKELNTFSQIMGRSKEDILRDAKKLLSDPDLVLWMHTLPRQTRETITQATQAIAGAFGEEAGSIVGEQILQQMASPFGQITDFAVAMGHVSPRLRKDFMQFSNDLQNNAIDPKDMRERVVALAKVFQNLTDEEKKRLYTNTYFNTTLKGGAQTMNKVFSELLDIDFDRPEQGLDNLSQTTLKLRNQWQGLMTNLEALMNTSFMKFSPAITFVIEKLNDLAIFINRKFGGKDAVVAANMTEKGFEDGSAVGDVMQEHAEMMEKVGDSWTHFSRRWHRGLFQQGAAKRDFQDSLMQISNRGKNPIDVYSEQLKADPTFAPYLGNMILKTGYFNKNEKVMEQAKQLAKMDDDYEVDVAGNPESKSSTLSQTREYQELLAKLLEDIGKNQKETNDLLKANNKYTKQGGNKVN